MHSFGYLCVVSHLSHRFPPQCLGLFVRVVRHTERVRLLVTLWLYICIYIYVCVCIIFHYIYIHIPINIPIVVCLRLHSHLFANPVQSSKSTAARSSKTSDECDADVKKRFQDGSIPMTLQYSSILFTLDEHG